MRERTVDLGGSVAMMTAMRLVRRPPVLRASAALALFVSMLAPAAAHAQAPELHPIREALARYDLEGDRTLGSLRELGRALTLASSEDARREARFLRAAVATDLLIAVTMDPAHAGLERRVSEALGVAPEGLVEHLRAELGAVRSGVYRRVADDALSTLELRETLAHGEAVSIEWSRHRGPRRDLLLLRAAAAGVVPRMAADPCAARGCPAPYAELDPVSRRELAALVEVSSALARVQEAARGGDPLAQSLVAHTRPAAARVAETVVVAAPRVPESLPIQPAAAGGEALRLTLLIAIGPEEVRIARAPTYGAREGRPVARETGDDVLPGSVSVPLPTELRPVIIPIDAVVEALRAFEPAPGAAIAIAASPDVPAHVVARVVASAQRAERAPTAFVRRAPDGTLRGIPIALADSSEVGVAGDLCVRVRLGGYGVARGRGRETTIPRVLGENGRRFDVDGLATSVGRIPHRRVALDAMATVRAEDFFDVAFRLARPDAPILLTN